MIVTNVPTEYIVLNHPPRIISGGELVTILGVRAVQTVFDYRGYPVSQIPFTKGQMVLTLHNNRHLDENTILVNMCRVIAGIPLEKKHCFITKKHNIINNNTGIGITTIPISSYSTIHSITDYITVVIHS